MVEAELEELREHLVPLRLDVRLGEGHDVDGRRDAAQRPGHALQPLALAVARDLVGPSEEVVLEHLEGH